MKSGVRVILGGLLLLANYLVVPASADTPDYLTASYPEAASYEPYTEPPSPTFDPTQPPNSCWDCDGSTYTWEEARVSICSPAGLAENPQMLDECFPDTWEWVCFPMPPDGSGTCEMYRRDLDPLGIFATPAPLPTPEPLPSPNPEPTATPSVEATPEPSNP